MKSRWEVGRLVSPQLERQRGFGLWFVDGQVQRSEMLGFDCKKKNKQSGGWELRLESRLSIVDHALAARCWSLYEEDPARLAMLKGVKGFRPKRQHRPLNKSIDERASDAADRNFWEFTGIRPPTQQIFLSETVLAAPICVDCLALYFLFNWGGLEIIYIQVDTYKMLCKQTR